MDKRVVRIRPFCGLEIPHRFRPAAAVHPPAQKHCWIAGLSAFYHQIRPVRQKLSDVSKSRTCRAGYEMKDLRCGARFAGIELHEEHFAVATERVNSVFDVQPV